MSKDIYTVIYWYGGSKVGEWRRTTLRTKNISTARAQEFQLYTSGYPAYIKTLHELETLGMPEGPPPKWDFKNLKWKQKG